MKKIIGILFVAMLLLPYSTGIAYASELVTQEEITRENLEKVELYQILDGYLRDIGLSIELFSETQIDFENLTYEAPEAVQSFSSDEDEIELKTTEEYLTTKELAQKKFGANPTEIEEMKTYLLYYFDLSDTDKTNGRVGKNIRKDVYFPDYMTKQDHSSYDAFIQSTYGRKLLDVSVSTANLAQSGAGVFNSINKLDLKNKVNRVRNQIAKIKDVLFVAKEINDYYTTNVVNAITSPEGFIHHWNIAVSESSLEKVEREMLDSIGEEIINISFNVLCGLPLGVMAGITAVSTATIAKGYLTLYDQAAINSLAYSRGTRLTLRQYESWWG